MPRTSQLNQQRDKHDKSSSKLTKKISQSKKYDGISWDYKYNLNKSFQNISIATVVRKTCQNRPKSAVTFSEYRTRQGKMAAW